MAADDVFMENYHNCASRTKWDGYVAVLILNTFKYILKLLEYRAKFYISVVRTIYLI